MKKINSSFVKRAVLLLTFALLFTLVAATSVWAGDPTETLVFHFDPEKCSVVLMCEQLGQEEITMESDVPVEIPYGAEVTVEVRPQMGYSIANIRDAATNASIKQPGSNPATYKELFFTNSLIANVECTTRVFSVDFEIGDIFYKPIDGDLDDFDNVEFHYMQPSKITVLPDVSF